MSDLHDDEIEFDVEGVSDQIGEELFGALEAADDIEIEVEAPKAEGEEPSEEAAPTGEDEPVSTEETDLVDGLEPVVEPELDTKNAPKTWRKEAAAAWATVPDVVKAEIAKREADMFKGIEQYRVNSDIGTSFAKLVDPYLGMLAQDQVNPFQHVNDLLAAHRVLRLGTNAEKAQMIQQLVKDFQVQFDVPASEEESLYVDPQVATLQKRVQELESTHQRTQQESVSRRKAELEAEVAAFSNDPANIYINELNPKMVELLRTGVAKTLREAYDTAVWMVPEVRSKELKRQAAEKQKKQAEHAKGAKETLKANVRTTPRQVSGTAPVGSMEQTIEETFREIKSRG